MDDTLQLLEVMEDARLQGLSQALAELGAELAARLGVSDAGGDPHGLWLNIEVARPTREPDHASAPAAHVPPAAAPVRHRMRWLWPGRFWMGSAPGEAGSLHNEGPRHEVVLTRGLWLSEVPVTQALYQALVGHNPSAFVGEDHPVEQVSWHEAVALCRRLSERLPGLQLRLPTEAQWEYAARAGTPDGPDEGAQHQLRTFAWHYGNSASDGERSTWPVGQLQPNAWGLHDMLGNVWEWCADRAPGQPAPYPGVPERIDPLHTEGPARVVRGGSWFDQAHHVRAARRGANEPEEIGGNLGFRLSAIPSA